MGTLSRAWYTFGMSIITPKHPHINIDLIGEDGNAFSIIGRVTRTMKRRGLSHEVSEFVKEATSGDYDNLLTTVMRWFTTDGMDEEEATNDCSLCGEDLYECECDA